MYMKMTRFLYLMLLVILMISGCGSNNSEKDQAIIPTETEAQPVAESTAEIVGIKTTKGETQVLVLEKGQLTLLKAELVNDGEITFGTDPASEQDAQSSHAIDGYFNGEIHWQTTEDNLVEVFFVDSEMGKHLDLLEIQLGEGEEIWNLHVTPDFSKVRYQVLNGTHLKAYEHLLDTNTSTAIGDAGEALLLTEEGQLGVLKGTSISWKADQSESDPLKKDETLYDVVINNGVLMDPETDTMKFGYNIGILGNEISTITKAPLDGNETIDATGLIVSPGFIDMLSFNLNATSSKFKILDGVTTALSTHGCTEDFEGFFRQYEKNPVFINYGGAVYAIRLRFEQGLSGTGAPTEGQIERMAARVEEEINAGGLALAFSPEYYPGTTPEEITAMMQVAAKYDIPTHFHARYSAIQGEFTGIDGVHEVLDYGRETGGRVHFMHLHSTGGTGMMDEALEAIDQARLEGVKVSYDIYPYDFWISRIQMARYSPGWQERYGITYSDLQMAGTTERLTEESFNYYRSVGGLCIAYAMNEDEIIQSLSEPDAMVGSDETISSETSIDSHPRGAGTFSKILGRYVRDENHFSLMDGIRKMTINSVYHLEHISNDMALRGRLQEGKIADITLFDYRMIIDQALPSDPAIPSTGVEYVLVSGKVAVEEGQLNTSVKNGQPIKSDFATQ